MKKLILIIFLIAGVGAGAHAQHAKKHEGQLPKQLSKKLNLTADQQTKVDAIMKNKAAQLDSLSSKSLAKKADHKQRKSINQASDEQINAVLNDAQKKTYADFKTEQMEKIKAKKSAAASTPPATPTPPAGN